jgi:hypothetical protein
MRTVFIKMLTGASLLALVVVAQACSGKDIPIGQTTQPLMSGGCTPEKCVNIGGPRMVCAQSEEDIREHGPATFIDICIPDPHAGQGSDTNPPGACLQTCVPVLPPDAGTNATCPPNACENQVIACATEEGQPEKTLTDVQCVPDLHAGEGSDPVGHCILVGTCK